ncbi:hypothetical protein K469DRAFT_553956 [Zopfia rhizophila CBS 207.26]|uniref:Uncharacterized protein n=1 Tax=Zopfia rhizophila CBS 207.26 TaxID=1314779 RepID=A0A6A6EK50_9PEZI|nr:hypothetical protein K469DRAFT_553956 [Zopfia rhizophila CBS 207.26]
MAEDTTNAAEAEDSKDSKSKTPKQETQKNDSAPKDVKDNQPKRKKQKQDTSKDNKDQSSKPQRQKEKQKLPRLPDNAKISKRPIHHPAIPSPFSSSSSQKVVYIKTHSKLIPTTKLIRKLLSQVENREKKSLSSKKIRLNPQKVEQAIVDAGKEKGGVRNSEPVFVKATGKAIETALEIGLFFQQQADCRVRIETASAEAIDDILLERGEGKKRKFEEVPETRIRTVSTITVAISLK